MDPLIGGAPKRLIQNEGTWILEVQRLVAVDSTVFRPHIQRLEGVEQITAYFRRNPHAKQLAAGAQRLLQSPPGGGMRSFEAVGGEWVPSALSPDYLSELKRQVRAPAQQRGSYPLLQLQMEVHRMRSDLRAIQERLAMLEARAGVGDSPAIEGAAPEPAAASLESNAQTFAGPVAEPRAVGATLAAVKLPPLEAFVRALKQVIGNDVGAQVAAPIAIDASSVFYASLLQDDSGAAAGAILLDLKATVFLGGTLMMTPPESLNQQLANAQPSEDSLEASLEVCHALTGTINKLIDNSRLRPSPLALLDLAKLDWLASAAGRIDLLDSFGGRLVIVCR